MRTRSTAFRLPQFGIGALLLLALLVSPATKLAAADPALAKLAIAASGDSGEYLADILTAELASAPGVALLERTALAKAVQEQGLNGRSSSGVIAAGRLLGADGLLVLETRRLSGAHWASLRLVAVRHGISVAQWEYTVQNDRTLEWAQGASAQVRELVPKLTNDTKASAIAFVGFTSPASSRAGATLERELNALILNRISAEPGLVVLERRKLHEASFEKALGADDSQFWNSAYLIEGAINADRIQSEEIRIDARLMPREGGAPLPFVARGWRTNLAELGTQCVDEIRRALKLKPTSLVWTPGTEAKRFFERAQDAARWELWAEAAEAADAALALGKDDLDTRQIRLRGYTGLFAIDYREMVRRRYKPRFGVMERYTPAPGADALSYALDTAYQLQDLARLHPKSITGTVHRAASNAVVELGQFTLKFYMGAELRRGNEEKLADLCAAMRAFTDLTLTTAGAATPMVPLLVDYGVLWQETPEDGVKLHRRLRGVAGYRPFVFGPAESLGGWPSDNSEPTDWLPTLCGWKWSDRSRVDTVWEAFTRAPEPKPQGEPGRVLMRVPAIAGARAQVNTNRLSGSPKPLLPGTTTNHIGAASSPVTSETDFTLTARTFVLTNGMLRKVHRVTHQESKLWVFFETGTWESYWTQTGGGTRMVEKFLLTALGGPGPSETIHIPDKFLSFHENKAGVQYAVFPERVLFVLEQEALVFDRRSKSFAPRTLPIRTPSVYRHGGRLFLYNEEALLETTSDLKDFRVLASLRRRPAASPLDGLTAFKNPLVTGAGSQLLFAFEGGVYRLQEDGWQRTPGTTLSARGTVSEKIPVTYWSDEILIREELSVDGGRTACRTYYYGPLSPEPELWWSGVLKQGTGFPMTEVIEPEKSGTKPHYTMLPAAAPFHYLQNEFAGNSRRAAFPLRGHLATLTIERNPGLPGLLELWLPDRPRPVTFSAVFGKGFPSFDSQLTLGADGIYLWGSQALRIWHFEMNDVMSRISKLVPPESKPPKQ